MATQEFTTQENDAEIWKPIPGYEGYYHISNLGRVWSDRYSRLLKSQIAVNSYLRTELRGKTYYIHKLVMLAFVGERPKTLQVNHKDGNKQNNRLENLEYVTPKENIRHHNR